MLSTSLCEYFLNKINKMGFIQNFIFISHHRPNIKFYNLCDSTCLLQHGTTQLVQIIIIVKYIFSWQFFFFVNTAFHHISCPMSCPETPQHANGFPIAGSIKPSASLGTYKGIGGKNTHLYTSSLRLKWYSCI